MNMKVVTKGEGKGHRGKVGREQEGVKSRRNVDG
jgi:hypothetical protein